jgi:hypothetical protein
VCNVLRDEPVTTCIGWDEHMERRHNTMTPGRASGGRSAGYPPLGMGTQGGYVPPHYMRRSEAARFLGLAPGTLANWASAGKGPAFHRVGRIPLYSITELRRYVESRRIGTTEAA